MTFEELFGTHPPTGMYERAVILPHVNRFLVALLKESNEKYLALVSWRERDESEIPPEETAAESLQIYRALHDEYMRAWESFRTAAVTVREAGYLALLERNKEGEIMVSVSANC